MSADPTMTRRSTEDAAAARTGRRRSRSTLGDAEAIARRVRKNKAAALAERSAAEKAAVVCQMCAVLAWPGSRDSRDVAPPPESSRYQYGTNDPSTEDEARLPREKSMRNAAAKKKLAEKRKAAREKGARGGR